MKFSWPHFLQEHNIPFVTEGEGKHTRKGNVNIKCPWCGAEERSEHMGLSLNERQPFYACWRNQSHRGRNPVRLVSALLGCSWKEAEEIVGRDDMSSIDSYEESISRVLTPPRTEAAQEERDPPRMPKAFHPLWSVDHRGRTPFLNYLSNRGFDHVEQMAKYYDLYYCRVGYFAQRIIIPVFFEEQLVTWAARAIGKTERRYVNLAEDQESAQRQGVDAPALHGTGDIVFNYDRAIRGGRTLIVCEGPFDALKIDWFAEDSDVAIALFGMPKRAQMNLLMRLIHKFDRACITLDSAEPSQNYRVLRELQACCGTSKVSWLDLPSGIKDPGELRGLDIPELINGEV